MADKTVQVNIGFEVAGPDLITVHRNFTDWLTNNTTLKQQVGKGCTYVSVNSFEIFEPEKEYPEETPE